jgi:hypothetical protein
MLISLFQEFTFFVLFGQVLVPWRSLSGCSWNSEVLGMCSEFQMPMYVGGFTFKFLESPLVHSRVLTSAGLGILSKLPVLVSFVCYVHMSVCSLENALTSATCTSLIAPEWGQPRTSVQLSQSSSLILISRIAFLSCLFSVWNFCLILCHTSVIELLPSS